MEFPTPAVQAAYERVAPMIKEIFGEFAYFHPGFPGVSVTMGSAYVNIRVADWGSDDAVIQTFSYVITGAEMTPELMRYLLTENFNLRFGAFGVDDEGDIILQHTIGASACDKDDLKASAMAIVLHADRIDDVIMAKFGGQRAIDRAPAADDPVAADPAA